MGYQISPTCFYLTTRDLIRELNKSELTTELENTIKNIPTYFQRINDFMAYATKVSIKEQNLKTYDFSSVSSAFFSSHAVGWILFLMCTKKTASKQVREDK